MNSKTALFAGLSGLAGAGVGFLASYLLKSKPRNPQVESFDFKCADDLSSLPKDQMPDALNRVFDKVVDDFLDEVKQKYDLPQTSLDRLRKMLKYTVPGGKYYRATITLNAVKTLTPERASQLTFPALVLGWCVEILQACFLVADDLMDGSITRRGQPCWYKLPDVQNDAVNDSLILESFIYVLLRKYLSSHPAYLQLVELYHDVSLQTQIGQMLDLTSQPQGRKDPDVLKGFTIDTYRRIVKYKTSVYTFYLPAASAMILCGPQYSSAEQLKAAYDLSVAVGTKFQIEDDYLDCYGKPEVIGKIGTDIKDHKCSWLVVQALQRVNEEQRKLLEAHYGKEEKESEEKIKQLYRDLDLESVYFKEEDDSKAAIEKLIKENERLIPAELFAPILKMIHNRQK